MSAALALAVCEQEVIYESAFTLKNALEDFFS